MTSESEGAATLAPTASILPSRRTTVPFSIVPLVMVSIRAFVSANVPVYVRM